MYGPVNSLKTEHSTLMRYADQQQTDEQTNKQTGRQIDAFIRGVVRVAHTKNATFKNVIIRNIISKMFVYKYSRAYHLSGNSNSERRKRLTEAGLVLRFDYYYFHFVHTINNKMMLENGYEKRGREKYRSLLEADSYFPS